MQRKIMPDIVNKQSISTLKPDNTVYEAATMMAKVNVAAIVVEAAEVPSALKPLTLKV